MPETPPADMQLRPGRRYAFEGCGTYEVLTESQYELQREDGGRASWTSWVVARVGPAPDGGEAISGEHECMVLWPQLGLCFATLVEPEDRPARAERCPQYCGVSTGRKIHNVDLSLREDGQTVSTRSIMTAWLDNGEAAHGHADITDHSVIWIEERFLEVPEDEDPDYMKTLNLRVAPIRLKNR